MKIIIQDSDSECNVRSELATKQDILQAIAAITNLIMAKNSELAGIINGIKTQVDKVKGEITKKIQDLEDALNTAHDDEIPAEVATALDNLKSSVQGADDIVPDAPADGGGEPTGTPPAAALAASRKNNL